MTIDDATAATPAPPAVRFSLVTAVYDVARYLPDFIDSIEKQTFPLDQVQVVAVDDGSNDDSLVVLKEWQARRPDLVTVLTKQNGGQGSARNLGLEHVRGEWVSFPDPDDMLEPEYLSSVDTFLQANPQTAMVATNRIFLEERTGKLADTHPLRRMFAGGDRLVDLDRFPDSFHGSAPAAFVRTDVVRSADVRFDGRVRPNFEDGHFCCRYLIAAGRPLVGFLASARYIYRRRGDGTSTLQTSLTQQSRYTDVPRYGYLDVLERATGDRRYPPEWLQNFVLYELSYYFGAEAAITGGSAIRGEVAEQFLEALRLIAERLDPAVIGGFTIRRFDTVWRDVLLHGLRDERWVTPYAVVRRYDEVTKQAQIAYRFVGEPPEEKILHRGLPVQVVHGKIRGHLYFGRTMVRERLAWVPAKGTLRVLLDGTAVELRPDWPPSEVRSVRPAQLTKWFGEQPKRRRKPTGVSDRLFVRLARSGAARRLFKDSWVVMDRIDEGGDSGEILFRYLRRKRRDINAWFVIAKDTPDWERMKRDGYRRLIAHGSLRWKVLMLNCTHLISSHADAPLKRPRAITELVDPEWKFVFLQHGVIKDDLSRYLNNRDVDMVVTSTPGEQQSIVGDGTAYAYTTREARMTGLPRFDRLLEMAKATPAEERRTILVCPTWRHWLNVPRERGSHRTVVVDDFEQTEYAQQWLGLLTDPRLRDLAEQHRLDIGFLPHPNIQPVLPRLHLPRHVRPISYAGQDIQRLVARTALMVTDYSSIAFNAAYLDRPVVYFQFDPERVLGGQHTSHYGYFDYERDAFGPVTTTVDATVAAIEAVVARGCTPGPDYQPRIDATFPQRDGNCCKRTVAAIEGLSRA